MNRQLPAILKARLAEPLPGAEARSRFDPRPWPRPDYDTPPPDARFAAVLILLYPHEGRWHLPLTLRPRHLPAHAGQVSLPGGAIAPGETSQAAAVREFHEELGADDEPIELIGRLSPIYVHASNFRVEPWVGTAQRRPAMAPNAAEVAELLEVPLAHLVNPANFASHQRQQQGVVYEAPHFSWPPHRIWGATCRILGELVTILGELGIDDW
jgi:8-oxo-dGTP pyrophosphatase MutT (NUDIX family)